MGCLRVPCVEKNAFSQIQNSRELLLTAVLVQALRERNVDCRWTLITVLYFVGY